MARSAKGEAVLQGFPRQWIPLLIYYGASFIEPTAPQTYIPLASDLSASKLRSLSLAARSNGELREMVEAFASLDPLIADVLHKLDRRSLYRDDQTKLPIKLTGWQSYGRPEVLALNRLISATAEAHHNVAIILPCARKRPYSASRTHRRIWSRLEARGIERSQADVLVVSSIGIVPENLWDHPVVTAYDSGVPDIYRVLRLLRRYFHKTRYARVVDCLEFRPYSDCLEIVEREGLIGSILSMPCGKRKVLPEP
jgi:archaeosine synthase